MNKITFALVIRTKKLVNIMLDCPICGTVDICIIDQTRSDWRNKRSRFDNACKYSVMHEFFPMY